MQRNRTDGCRRVDSSGVVARRRGLVVTATMMGCGLFGMVFLLPVAARAVPAAQAAAVRCEALAGVQFDSAVGASTKILSSQAVMEGSRPGYCQVKGTIAPAIGFEVRLPLEHWTDRFLQTGCGGLCGTMDIRIEKAAGCLPVQNGELALASTDMGHQGGFDGQWGRENYQARIDFAYRGVHSTTLAAKALIKAFYGHAPRYSYFSGCSDGGREALMEAQRYPHDFNAIMAGAPAMNFTTQNSFYHGWNALRNQHPDGTFILTADKLPILHRAVVAQCDAQDGLKDGLISDPIHCEPDLETVTCREGQAPESCLSAEQAQVAREIYRGAHDTGGRGLVISGPLPGSEINWTGVFVPPPGQNRILSSMVAEGTIKNLASDPNPPEDFKLKDLKFDEATFTATTRLHGLYDSTNTDLTAFAAAGGRLILWHGLADPHISPLNTVAYFTALQKRLGTTQVSQFARLYLFPGGDHCGGGEGPFDVDLLSALMQWTEHGVAPAGLIASHSDEPRRRPGETPAAGLRAEAQGHIDRTRPVFPYPQTARYSGRGSPDEASSFTPYPGQPWPINERWYGSSFFSDQTQLWCDGVAHGFKCRAGAR